MDREQKPMFIVRSPGIFERNNDIFRLVRDYEWISAYRRTKDLQAEIADLEKLKIKTNSAKLTKKELLDLAKEFFNEYENQRIETIQKSLINVRDKKRNPFLILTQTGKLYSSVVGSLDLNSFLTWPEVKSAVNRILEDPGALSVKDRKKALDHIDQRLKSLKKELLEVFPKSSRFRTAGAVGGDLRSELINNWQQLQKQCTGPIGPAGAHLKYSSEKEKAAHKELQIDRLVNPQGHYRPYEDN